MNKHFLHIISIIILLISFQQELEAQKINPNGYNKFTYPDGTLSSEGNMKNGKPVGYWKSYYPSGKLKTEGNRKNEKLDSVWRFYDRQGHLTEVIDYKNNIKSGYYKKYKLINDSDYVNNVLISKELYINGEKNGKSYYYDDRARLSKTIEFEKNYKNGYEKHFDTTGNIILILKYSYNNIINSEKLNRKDKFGKKQGVWKTFYGNDKIKTYANYKDDILNGYYREYNPYGELIKSEYYIEGKLQILTEDEKPENKIKIVKELYPNGKIKNKGTFIKNKPVGIHKTFNEKGKVIASKTYSDDGKIIGEGIVDKKDKKQGEWKFLYDNGKIRSSGKFVNGKKEGKWLFYFPSGKTEQKGVYKNGKYSGIWIWYYENGNLRRTGKFKKGKEEGFFYELSEEGDTLSRGNYIYGMKSGEWKYSVNDFIETGKYVSGKKEGVWKQYYSDNKLKFEGNYIEGFPDGKHKHYYPDGKIKLIAEYAVGNKTGKWKKYDKEGNLETLTEYKANKKYKIDGQKIKNN
ncbi:MAG: hypothetical protein L3J35_12625 [Bacteroidales bacterium]|nr:hypothetical protein [Bacteroidales bacterium]